MVKLGKEVKLEVQAPIARDLKSIYKDLNESFESDFNRAAGDQHPWKNNQTKAFTQVPIYRFETLILGTHIWKFLP